MNKGCESGHEHVDVTTDVVTYVDDTFIGMMSIDTVPDDDVSVEHTEDSDVGDKMDSSCVSVDDVATGVVILIECVDCESGTTEDSVTSCT